jgi:hypothetical protein
MSGTSSGSGGSKSGFLEDVRAQSETIGVVLILGMVILGMTAVIGFGSQALDATEQRSEIASAEHAMTQLDSEVSLVGFNSSSSQRVDLGIQGTGGTARANDTSGHITIDKTDGSGTTTTLLDTDLGAVVYENEDATIAYQGGGVWKRTGGGSTMVSPPEFHYRDTTLTLPLIVVNGSGRLGSRVQVSPGPSRPVFPVDGVPSKSNPLVGESINVTITSAYYEAWGRFFEERTGGNTTYDRATRTVTVTLVAPEIRPPIANGVVSTSPGKRLDIDGKHGDVGIDTYDSSSGDYAATGGSGGTIVTSGGVKIKHGKLKGNLVSGSGEVRLEKDSTITGDLAYGGTLSSKKGSPSSHVGDTITADGSTSEIAPIGGFIDQKQSAIESNNDNDDTSAIDDQGDSDPTNDELDDSQTSWTLTNGKYYFEKIDLKSGETLTLDNTGGPIEIYVEKDVKLDDATLEVLDETGGTVRIYVERKKIEFTKGSTMTVPEDDATKLWLYSGQHTDVKIEGASTTVVGAIYAPSGDAHHGKVDIRKEAELYGAVVGGDTKLKEGAEIHYDEALGSAAPIPPGSDVPLLKYLHATVNTVNVTDG